MSNRRTVLFLLLGALVLSAPGCEVVEGIFKAGVGVGLFLAVLVVGLVIALVSKFRA